jgi:hypothetical protein
MSFKDDVIAGLKKVNKKTVVGILASFVAIYFLLGVYSYVNSWWAGPGSDPAKNLAVKEALEEKRQKVLAMERANLANEKKLEEERLKKEQELKALQDEIDDLNYKVDQEKVRCNAILEHAQAQARNEIDAVRKERRALIEKINNLRFNNQLWDKERVEQDRLEDYFSRLQSDWNREIDNLEAKIKKRIKDIRNKSKSPQVVEEVLTTGTMR